MNFRGTLRGTNCPPVTRAAFDSMKSSAECEEGSIITELYERKNGGVGVNIRVNDCMCASGRLIWGGTLQEYIKTLEKAMEAGR